MDQVTIAVETRGDHFACVGVVRSLKGEVLHVTKAHPFGMDGQARQSAERECLRCDWDDVSGPYVRAVREARKVCESARATAQGYRTRDVHIDAAGYLCSAKDEETTLAQVADMPGMLDAALALRTAVQALSAAERGY